MILALPCAADGTFLAPNSPPPPADTSTSWAPFTSRAQFAFAEESFERSELSEGSGDNLCKIYAAHMIDTFGLQATNHLLFEDTDEVHQAIDDIAEGEAPWREFTIRYTGEVNDSSPPWMRTEYTVHCRDALKVVENMAASEDFKNSWNYRPYREFIASRERRWSNLMSGHWAWKQAVCFYTCSVLPCKRFHDDCLKLT